MRAKFLEAMRSRRARARPPSWRKSIASLRTWSPVQASREAGRSASRAAGPQAGRMGARRSCRGGAAYYGTADRAAKGTGARRSCRPWPGSGSRLRRAAIPAKMPATQRADFPLRELAGEAEPDEIMPAGCARVLSRCRPLHTARSAAPRMTETAGRAATGTGAPRSQRGPRPATSALELSGSPGLPGLTPRRRR